MRSNYKRLGDYIREVNIRNSELKELELLGISIQKKFIPSIANTIGTDMSKYKIVKKNQFAYGTVTSRNGDKISIALLEGHEEVLISQAYVSFEVIDENELLPEYLMMWFRRKEFDRYARYMSYGSAREVFSWEEMCNVELPIPSLEKQKIIVKEYKSILSRIKLNENRIEKLESLAQAVYIEWFENFKIPIKVNSPRCIKKKLSELIDIKHGFAFKGEYITNIETSNILLTPGNFQVGGGFKGDKLKYYNGETQGEFILEARDILVTMTDLSVKADTIGYPAYIPNIKNKKMLHNQRLGKILFKEKQIPNFIYWTMRSSKYRREILAGITGTTVKHTSPSKILEFEIDFCEDDNVLKKFEQIGNCIQNNIELIYKENLECINLKKLLLLKLSN